MARRGLGRSLIAIGLRYLFWVPVGLLFNALVIRGLLGLDRLVEAAVMTMFVLPLTTNLIVRLVHRPFQPLSHFIWMPGSAQQGLSQDKM